MLGRGHRASANLGSHAWLGALRATNTDKARKEYSEKPARHCLSDSLEGSRKASLCPLK